MKSKLLSMLDKTLDTLPMTGAAIGVTMLACVFSGTLRDILQRANLDLLAGAVALLPLSAVLLAFGYGMRADPARLKERARRERQLERRKAMLRATYDLDNRP
ncbi:MULTISPECIES: hypothetical protein [unclassified Herbaspirillum]|uniref:hypothetical protein n=1 Tax=unclassified Herbaspirillum TaxID=2624150 RepID=UPI001150B65E|nr:MULTISPECIES: hypothetical protein [unclassified Herbaspirillum]MBB5391183.1 energy-converting hydrogenase Eha subunit C [Herbaspirillum sp. SJZ102]TQK13126.1 hypothetical protein FB599_0536 [Herbaspirillum sp. SJZ130]TQK15130.1 hypothetical protein FB598_0474 [Herbaspirillum sp. SJZ106]